MPDMLSSRRCIAPRKCAAPAPSPVLSTGPTAEGLRLDEAMHPLTLMAVGLYGKTLPKQNGAPLRLVVPWKYGFKSIKSIVRIRLSEQRPVTTWEALAPREYGFYANVNPEVDHPRWSQASERRLPSTLFRPEPHPHQNVQRLRRAGGPPLSGYGSGPELLSYGAICCRIGAFIAVSRCRWCGCCTLLLSDRLGPDPARSPYAVHWRVGAADAGIDPCAFRPCVPGQGWSAA